jgi:plastocyanin
VGLRTIIGVVLGGGALVVGAGCSATEQQHDLVAGKKAFAEKCGSCHTLARAQTKGTQGPNLDQAFQQGLADGMKRNGIQGTVYAQIQNPARIDKKNPVYMPPKLAKGREAENIAAYVADSVSAPGKDTGLLATAVKKPGSGKPVAAKDGVLTIPATAQLAYEANAATAEAGQLDIKSPNPSGTPHDIAIEGNGVKGAGKVVQDGGVSEVKVTVKPGTYAFFCTVPGHREGGMEGKLTVK